MNTKKVNVIKYLFLLMVFGTVFTACWPLTPDDPTPPSVPTNVRAAATSSTSIAVTWSFVSNADKYEVHYQTGSLPITRLAEVSGTQYSHTGLQPNTAYSYYITAKNSLGTSDLSSRATATTLLNDAGGTKPAVPTGVKASAVSSTSVKITWDPVPLAASYDVHYTIGSSSDKNFKANVANPEYTHNGLQPNTRYNYYIIAKNSAGESGYSTSASVTTPTITTQAVTSVTVSPKTISVEKGKTQSFSATVAGPNNPSQDVVWTIDQSGRHSGTTISAGGLLTVSASESLSTITVRATSKVDSSKSDTATVTVTTAPSSAPPVTGVTVNPKTISVEKGKTQSFSATVAGPNNPSQDVAWTIDQSGRHSGTTISVSGLLTVSASESLTALTVRATSKVDSSKSDTATVTVTIPIVNSVTVSPKTVSVEKGKTQSFSAMVAGPNSPAQTVTWSIVQTNKNSGTTINSTTGLLTVSASENLAELTVRATSAVDTSKSDTATVTVTAAAVVIPAAPTGVRAEQSTRGNNVTVSWNAVPGATSYRVYYGAKNSNTLNSYKVVEGTTATTYTYTDNAGARIVGAYTSRYFYKVSAINSAGEGPATSAVAEVSW